MSTADVQWVHFRGLSVSAHCINGLLACKVLMIETTSHIEAAIAALTGRVVNYETIIR